MYTNVLAPEEAPRFVYQPFTFFHAVEWSEKLKNAQLLRHIYFSLPPELSTEQHIALVNDFVGQAFVSMGMVATVAIHQKNGDDGKPNPNAHVLLNTRPLLPDGSFAPKTLTSFCLDEHGKRIIGENGKYKRKNVKTTDWNYQGNGELWRRLWADITNKHLQLAGLSIQIDHRSQKRKEVTRIPTVYLNPADHQAERRGERTEIGDLNRWIVAENQRREKEEKRREAINNLLGTFMEKYKGLARRQQWRSPQTRATQQFWTDLHDIERQCTGEVSRSSSSKGHPSPRERSPNPEME